MTLTLRPIPGIDRRPPDGPLFPNDWPFLPLEAGAYDVIVADPPWRFDHWSGKGVTAKSAGSHYDTMTLEDIRALPVGELANPAGALCLMWVTAAGLPEQIEILKGWGFAYNTRIVWRKLTAAGKTRMSTGYRVRSCDEICVVGKIGRVARPRQTVRSIFDGVARSKRKGEEKSQHSRKPDEFWPHVAGIHPEARRWCELFAREARRLPSGLLVEPWGNQTEYFEEYSSEAVA